MNKIAVFYHVRLNGSRFNINQEKAMAIMENQMQDLEDSKLLSCIDEFHVCSNGSESESVPARLLAGKQAIFTVNGANAESELPTFGVLQDWLPSHPDWYVLYMHTKGVTKPDDPLRTVWRQCMMKSVVWNWQTCLAALEQGCDMAGAHWLTNFQYPQKLGLPTPIWGGNFWWAKASFLLELPPLIRKATPSLGLDGMVAENWIGFGDRNPYVCDLSPHWPTLENCSKNL